MNLRLNTPQYVECLLRDALAGSADLKMREMPTTKGREDRYFIVPEPLEVVPRHLRNVHRLDWRQKKHAIGRSLSRDPQALHIGLALLVGTSHSIRRQ